MFRGVHLWRVRPLGCLSPPKVYDEVSENADLIGLPIPRPPANQGGFAPLDHPGPGGRPSLVPLCGVLSVAQSADSQTKKEEKRAERHGARELKTRAWRIGASIPVPPAYTDQRGK